MNKVVASEPPAEEIELARALESRYLSYALSTIMHRALPDVRDGLKPVHRRLLYAMRQLRLDSNSGFKKSARVVGDVIGRYHPHGDQAVYDTLVRLAQDFAVRYPLIDGQGNFGNIDGDNAAAMRYTEARLTSAADALLENLDDDTVDFRETYDGEESEPVVLPANFPNLLANGANGIAVGMATSIPPHNVEEICDAALHLIKFPKATVTKLAEFIPGPDFPTGGIIVEPHASIVESYRTGRGGFRLRARWEVEKGARGTWNIVVTEIPFQVQKSRLIERLAELIMNRKLPLIGDVRDESAEDLRVVLEPKSRTVDPEVMMESLFKATDLETRISLNMNVLNADQIPGVMSLRDVIAAYLAHRQEVLLRRTRFRVERIERRLEVLKGYLIAYLNLDKVIRIIRSEDEPKPKLIKTFKLTDNQAEAILNMRLRALRKLEEQQIQVEDKALTDERKSLKALLKSETQQKAHLSQELKDLKKNFGAKTDIGKRRTSFAEAPEVTAELAEAFIEREPVTVVCSDKGWIRALKGHLDEAGLDALKYKEGDEELFAVHAQTTDKIILFATNGRFYTIAADGLPGGRGHGEPVRLMIGMDEAEEIVTLLVHEPGRKLLVASNSGHGFVVVEDEVIASTRNGKQVLNVRGEAEAAVCAFADGDTVAALGENRKLILFPLEEVPEMSKGRGVILQRHKDGGLADVVVFDAAAGLRDASGRTWSLKELKEWCGARGQTGRLPPRGFSRRRQFT